MNPAHVAGTVTYKGKLLKAGTVAFHTDGSGTYQSPINPDGTYSVRDIPTGELVVTVETESVNPKTNDPSAGKPLAGKYGAMPTFKAPEGAVAPEVKEYTKIPAIFANPKTTLLRATISSGSQTHNIVLKD